MSVIKTVKCDLCGITMNEQHPEFHKTWKIRRRVGRKQRRADFCCSKCERIYRKDYA